MIRSLHPAMTPCLGAVGATLIALVLMVGLLTGLNWVPAESAYAGTSHSKCKTIKKAGRYYKVKKIKVTRPISCKEARKVTKVWVGRKFNQNLAIQHGSQRNWFCTWHRRDPKSVDTGTADCEAGATDEIGYPIRRR